MPIIIIVLSHYLVLVVDVGGRRVFWRRLWCRSWLGRAIFGRWCGWFWSCRWWFPRRWIGGIFFYLLRYVFLLCRIFADFWIGFEFGFWVLFHLESRYPYISNRCLPDEWIVLLLLVCVYMIYWVLNFEWSQ